MKIDDIATWEAFRAVAVHGSFSHAARELKLAVPQISKRVAKLEDQLGVRLFQRSTRVVSLTDEGRSLLPRVSSLLEDLKSIESTFEDQEKLSGVIRVTCVPFVAHRLLINVIKKFQARYPDVHFELDLSEGLVNLVESSTDLAIRIHEKPEDSSLVYRKLSPNRLVLCASPAYLRKSAALKKPIDLRAHNLLMLNIHRNCRFNDNSYRLGELAKTKQIICENGWLLTQLALNDGGILLRSVWDVHAYLKNGELVQVLKKDPIQDFGSIYAVVASRRLLTPRVRTFLDFVTAEAATWGA